MSVLPHENPVPFNPHKVLTGSEITHHLEQLRTIYHLALLEGITDVELAFRVRQILRAEQKR